MEGTPQRDLTPGEIALLRPIFRDTLPYNTQRVARNDYNTGGRGNSFTPGYVPNMARTIWSLDYGGTTDDVRWIFIHEMTHVWQSTHGQRNIWNGFWIWAFHHDYDDAYPYNLEDSEDFFDYNMEQQASIVPDYWLVSRGLTPKYNAGVKTGLSVYRSFITPLLMAGPPEVPSYRLDNSGWNHGFKA